MVNNCESSSLFCSTLISYDYYSRPVNDWNRDYGNLPSHLDEIFDNDGEFLNVLKKIMKFNPLQRPSAADALLILQKEF